MIFTLITFKNDQNEEMRKLMPTCSNIIHPIIHFRFPVTWEKKSLESAANSISERLNIKIFSGSMPLDPPRGLPLQRWLLTLTTQPSTSKLSDNPALETMTRPNQGLSLSLHWDG